MTSSAETPNRTIPLLPSRSIAHTVAFYRRLGFVGDAHPHDAGYAILTRGDVELLFLHTRILNRLPAMRVAISGLAMSTSSTRRCVLQSCPRVASHGWILSVTSLGECVSLRLWMRTAI